MNTIIKLFISAFIGFIIGHTISATIFDSDWTPFNLRKYFHR